MKEQFFVKKKKKIELLTIFSNFSIVGSFFAVAAVYLELCKVKRVNIEDNIKFNIDIACCSMLFYLYVSWFPP
jgi:hypothetical protein